MLAFNSSHRASFLPLGLALALPLGACGGDDGSGGMGGETGQGGAGGAAMVTCFDRNAQRILALCNTFEPTLEGDYGDACNGNDDCMEGLGCGAGICTTNCNDGCPSITTCAPNSIGMSCLPKSSCPFAEDDLDSCELSLGQQISAGCDAGCEVETNAWIDCLVTLNDRYCTADELDPLCGAQRDALEQCCPGCASAAW